jgi:hypothetical protein
MASQEIPSILCNLKLHYCVHMNPTLVSVLRQMNPRPALTSYSVISILISYAYVFQMASFL